jgi:protein Tex
MSEAAPPTLPAYDPVPALAAELGLPRSSVAAVVALLLEGATVPFIARYRKEATGGLDEVQIRAIEERRTYLVELEERRASVLAEIDKQGKLTPSSKRSSAAATTKAELEDLYLPYKPKRRTRAMIAKERGLEPLADRMWAQPPRATRPPRPRRS